MKLKPVITELFEPESIAFNVIREGFWSGERVYVDQRVCDPIHDKINRTVFIIQTDVQHETR
jgi:hypothetical protein